MRSIEIFLNFPIMDINRNVLRRDPSSASEDQTERMTTFWGDESWREAAYRTELNLFGSEERKTTNEDLVAAFRERLKSVAGFAYVPEPMPMRDTTGAVVYYLFFAARKPVATKIVTAIFKKHRNRRG
jgi:three-Cys-motif partner protein